jgi:hypothetical protein
MECLIEELFTQMRNDENFYKLLVPRSDYKS